MQLKERYYQALAEAGFKPDPAQIQVVAYLQALFDALSAAPPAGEGIAGWLRSRLSNRRRAPVRGLYLWGPPGHGKTWLMDLFYASLPFTEKKRIHFHVFMQGVHETLAGMPRQKDPLRRLAQDLAQRLRVLCLDEFIVTNITDAMLLYGLLDNLFQQGVVLVATSNRIPRDLYRNGLQRDRFLPAIDLIQSRTQVMELRARVEAERTANNKFQLTTQNVTALCLTPATLPARVEVTIDGQTLHVTPAVSQRPEQRVVRLIRRNDRWSEGAPDWSVTSKRPGLQGPIDDAFLEPFLVVLPSGECRHSEVQRWVEFEQNHFLDRWHAVFRGPARVKRDDEVTPEDAARYHLVLWGDPASNSVLGGIVGRLPISWTNNVITVGQESFHANRHVLAMIHPNPDSPDRYVVLNSGPTFREAHDRTNSLQNPKLPDWAVLDLSHPPNGSSPGRVAAAEFFDEEWGIRRDRNH